jgi:putative sigma-54 modulation protein
MQIVEFKGTGLELTEAIKDYATEKLGKVATILDDIEPADVRLDLGKPSNHHHKGDIFRAEVNLQIPGGMIRAESETIDLYAAIDEAVDRLRAQVVKWKEKQSE